MKMSMDKISYSFSHWCVHCCYCFLIFERISLCSANWSVTQRDPASSSQVHYYHQPWAKFVASSPCQFWTRLEICSWGLHLLPNFHTGHASAFIPGIFHMLIFKRTLGFCLPVPSEETLKLL